MKEKYPALGDILDKVCSRYPEGDRKTFKNLIILKECMPRVSDNTLITTMYIWDLAKANKDIPVTVDWIHAAMMLTIDHWWPQYEKEEAKKRLTQKRIEKILDRLVKAKLLSSYEDYAIIVKNQAEDQRKWRSIFEIARHKGESYPILLSELKTIQDDDPDFIFSGKKVKFYIDPTKCILKPLEAERSGKI